MSENQAVRYIDGNCFVPDRYWQAVREYRKLRNIIEDLDSPKRLYSSKMDERMNQLFDWLLAN